MQLRRSEAEIAGFEREAADCALHRDCKLTKATSVYDNRGTIARDINANLRNYLATDSYPPSFRSFIRDTIVVKGADRVNSL